MDKDYKRIMRCVEITDHRSKIVDVKNLRVSLYMCKHIKVPKGLTLKTSGVEKNILAENLY